MQHAAYRIVSSIINGTLALILLTILANMGWRDATNDDSLSSRDFLKAIKGPQQLLNDKAKSFIAHAISRLPEGTFYTLPRNHSKARSNHPKIGQKISQKFLVK
jgi:hypothetical protein